MKEKGFTLIELLAVIVILAIIALIATPIILGVIDQTREKAYETSKQQIVKAAENYASRTAMVSEVGRYIPVSLLIETGFLTDPANEKLNTGFVKYEKVGSSYVFKFYEAGETEEFLKLDSTKTISKLKILGNSTQKETKVGKNILDIRQIGNNKRIQLEWLDTGISIIKLDTDNYHYVLGEVGVKPSTKYTLTYSYDLSYSDTYGDYGPEIFDLDRVVAGASWSEKTLSKSRKIDEVNKTVEVTFTTFSDTRNIRIVHYFGGSTLPTPVGAREIMKDIMLREAGTDATYESFVPNSPSILYPSAVTSVGDSNSINLVFMMKDGSLKKMPIALGQPLRGVTKQDQLIFDYATNQVTHIQAVDSFSSPSTLTSYVEPNDPYYRIRGDFYDIQKIPSEKVLSTHFLFLKDMSLAKESSLLSYGGEYSTLLAVVLNTRRLAGYQATMTRAEKNILFNNYLKQLGKIDFYYDLSSPVTKTVSITPFSLTDVAYLYVDDDVPATLQVEYTP